MLCVYRLELYEISYSVVSGIVLSSTYIGLLANGWLSKWRKTSAFNGIYTFFFINTVKVAMFYMHV